MNRTVVYWLASLLSAALGAYAVLGVLMSGSFYAASSATRFRTGAIVWEVICLASLTSAIGFGVAAWRRTARKGRS